MGYPFITVTSNGTGGMNMRQKRFLTNEDEDPMSPPSTFNYQWNIPISIFESDGTKQVYRFDFRNSFKLFLKQRRLGLNG